MYSFPHPRTYPNEGKILYPEVGSEKTMHRYVVMVTGDASLRRWKTIATIFASPNFIQINVAIVTMYV